MSLDWQACSDGELAVFARAGNNAAFAEIMRRHREPVYRLVRGYVRDTEEALDLTQDVFALAFEHLARYDRVRPLRAWLSRIAINKCRDWHRRARVRRVLSFFSSSPERHIALIRDEAPGAEAVAAARLELARVEAAIATLPATLRETLLLRTIEGLSQAEAAAVLDVTERAIETRLYRARAKLSEILSDRRGI